MKQYKELAARVLRDGEVRIGRNGHAVRGVFGGAFEHDLRDGFPLMTTKQMGIRSIAAELVGFLGGATSAAVFRQLGTKIWDQNANEEPGWLGNPQRLGPDDLGPIYGYQWRKWQSIRAFDNNNLADSARGAEMLAAGYKVLAAPQGGGGAGTWIARKEIDQMLGLIEGLKSDPMGRRHLVTAWNPGDLDRVALPACHTLFQCYVSTDGHLDLQMYQRSADLFLGVPYNIASYAMLQHVLAKLTGLKPRKLTIVFGDLHAYLDHIPAIEQQLGREPMALPELTLGPMTNLDDVRTDSFHLHGYTAHSSIAAKMAS